jgi:hypothetical protein
MNEPEYEEAKRIADEVLSIVNGLDIASIQEDLSFRSCNAARFNTQVPQYPHTKCKMAQVEKNAICSKQLKFSSSLKLWTLTSHFPITATIKALAN